MLDIHFHIHYPLPQGPEYLEQVVIESADPLLFVENSLRFPDSSPCCTMNGAFGVTLEAEPWNGGWDNYGEEMPPVPYYYMNAIGVYVYWLDATTALLNGALYYETLAHDDEGPVQFFRNRWGQVYFERIPLEPEGRRASLLDFAKLVLREGRKLMAFTIPVMAELVRRQLEPGLDKKALKVLKGRLDEVRGWGLPERIQLLEEALMATVSKPTLETLWNNLLDMAKDHRPKMESVLEEQGGRQVQIVILRWAGLPKEEKTHVEALVQGIGREGVRWQNPFSNRSGRHFLEGYTEGDDEVVLSLRTAGGRAARQRVN